MIERDERLEVDAASAGRERRSVLDALPLQLVRLARPHHWIKNAFVVVPVPFAVAAGATLDLERFLLGLAGFSLINSAVYVINDIRDAEADRADPRKRTRPVASGAVGVPLAWVWGVLLLVVGLGCAQATGSGAVVGLSAVYLAMNVAYSFGLKHVALVDVFVLAAGFLLRVLLGTALLAVAPSGWLLICASALALFLAFTKRRADMVAGRTAIERPALAGYNAAFLGQAMAIMCGVTLLAYALYSIDAAGFVPGRELTGMPFVAFALLQVLRLAYIEGRGASLVELALRSPSLQICALGWLVATLWSLGLF